MQKRGVYNTWPSDRSYFNKARLVMPQQTLALAHLDWGRIVSCASLMLRLCRLMSLGHMGHYLPARSHCSSGVTLKKTIRNKYAIYLISRTEYGFTNGDFAKSVMRQNRQLSFLPGIVTESTTALSSSSSWETTCSLVSSTWLDCFRFSITSSIPTTI